MVTSLGDTTPLAERIRNRSMLSEFLMTRTISDKNHRIEG
jgi:hypothetical protein